MNADISRIVAAVWPHVHDHVHDISVSALSAAVAMLGVVILLELRSVLKLRQVVDGNLARVFEQLDLLRFESQQLIEGQQLMRAHAQGSAASLALPVQAQPPPHQAQSRAAAAGAVTAAAVAAAPTAATLVAAPATAGEARLLSSLAQARARREAAGPLRA